MYRHGTAVSRKSSPDPKVNAAGPSAERGKEGVIIGRVALNPFPPLVHAGLGRSMGLVK